MDFDASAIADTAPIKQELPMLFKSNKLPPPDKSPNVDTEVGRPTDNKEYLNSPKNSNIFWETSELLRSSSAIYSFTRLSENPSSSILVSSFTSSSSLPLKCLLLSSVDFLNSRTFSIFVDSIPLGSIKEIASAVECSSASSSYTQSPKFPSLANA